MEQERPPQVASISKFLAFLGYVIGSGLVLVGAISWGLQLILMPIGLSMLVLAAARQDPPLAGGFVGGSIAITLASWFSYSLGLSETIFQPHPVLLVPLVGLLALLGFRVGRSIQAAR